MIGGKMLRSLKSLRKSNGYTQEQLANAIGATKRQIGAWERGENDLPLDYAIEIADLFGCSLDALVGSDRRSGQHLTPLETELIGIMRSITPQGQQQLLVFARGIAASYPKNNQVFEPEKSA